MKMRVGRSQEGDDFDHGPEWERHYGDGAVRSYGSRREHILIEG